MSIDLAGHGQSSHRPQCCRLHFLDYLVDVRDVIKGHYSCDVTIMWLFNFRAGLGWEKFSFLCHSMGKETWHFYLLIFTCRSWSCFTCKIDWVSISLTLPLSLSFPFLFLYSLLQLNPIWSRIWSSLRTLVSSVKLRYCKYTNLIL